MREVALAFLLISPALIAFPAHAAGNQMNGLFLVADDLNRWLPGDPHRYTGKVAAPNIIGLAESGVKLPGREIRKEAPSSVM